MAASTRGFLREGCLGAQPAIWLWVDCERGVVGVGDGLDDREAEAAAVAVPGSLRAESFERLEEPCHRLGGDYRPGVGDRDDCVAGAGSGPHLDAAARHVVA